MQRSHLAAVLLACGVLGVVLVVQRSGERDPRVVLPVFAPRTTLILCCDAVQHLKLDSALRYGTGLLWAHEGVSEEDMTQCKALFKRSVVLKGGLLQLFDRFSADDDLVVFDTNVHGPTSTFVMHTLLKRHVRLELHTVVVKPVGTTLGSDSSRVAIMKKQHKAFKALVKRLKADGKIEAGFGYHPERMAARWRAIERSLDGMPGELKTSAKCIDWGSNAGFFSVKLAERFREGWVMGVEGEAVAEYADARRTHLEMAEKAGVDKNTHICNTKVSGAEFEKISDKWQLDVQLSLSVFHWFKIKNHEDFLEKLGFHLAEATSENHFCCFFVSRQFDFSFFSASYFSRAARGASVWR